MGRCARIMVMLLALWPTQGTAQGVSPDGFVFGDGKLVLNVDTSIAGVHDNALRASMGREQQVKPVFFIVGLKGDIDPHISFEVQANPVRDDMAPRPYIPSPEDRRLYFFPNVPEGRGVTSDPEGLYKVDVYKHPGLDPILQHGMLRVGLVDVHTVGKSYGLRAGRFFMPQGFQLDELVWFTSRDLAHIQLINAQTDNGLQMYIQKPRYRAIVTVSTGNGNPYHDYGYFDFTDAVEDKNSAVAVAATGRRVFSQGSIGISLRKNFINSRIEDSTTFQLSKRKDDAAIISARYRPNRAISIYGEYAWYVWGFAPSSAELLPSPSVRSPAYKHGYYIGIDAYAPYTKIGRWGITYMREELSRDDALVSWAASRQLFGVTFGQDERTHIIKVHAKFRGMLSAFFFANLLSNPFPRLSAIQPLTDTRPSSAVSQRKLGIGLRFTM